jgi:hypothetical protein
VAYSVELGDKICAAIAAGSFMVRIDPAMRELRYSTHQAYLNLETRSAFSRMTLALSAAGVPVGSPLYITLGFDQKGKRGQPPQPLL